MSESYDGSHNDFRGSTFPGTFINEQHNYLPAHEVDWPVQIGSIPEQAAHYQHRAITDQLDEALNSFGTVVLRQVLSGTGGVGKTQLAARHARTLRDIADPDKRLDVLVWANAATRERITSAYAQAARQMFETVPEDPVDAAAAFLAWLQNPNKNQKRRWLVVWDDLVDPATVRDLWPPHDQPCGRVLVTTRRRDRSLATQGRHLLDVDVYTPNEARDFLTHALDWAGIPHTPDDLDTLAHDLGYLPLALGQAVTYIAERSMGCADYLELFRDRRRTLHEVFPDWETPTPLATTWELSLDQADTYAPRGVARPLMELVALLDGSGIPESVLTSPPVLSYLAFRRPKEQTPSAPEASDPPTGRKPGFLKRLSGALKLSGTASVQALTPQQTHAALANLHRLNLVTRTAVSPPTDNNSSREPSIATVGAHQLVQRATREHTRTHPTRLSVLILVNALLTVWTEVGHDTTLAQHLRDNTTALRSHHAVSGRSSEDWLWKSKGLLRTNGIMLLFCAGESLIETGRISEAVAHWQYMTFTADQRLGDRNRLTLAARHRLAHSRGLAGDLTGAVHDLQNLLNDLLRTLGPNHRETLAARHNLAFFLGLGGNPAAAADALQEVLNDLLRTLGPNHPDTLKARHHLAHLRGQTEDPTTAVQGYDDLLNDLLRTLGPNHPDTLKARHNLAHWRGQAGDVAAAAQALQDLLSDQQRVLGPDHPDTLTDRHSIAHLQGQAGDVAAAAQALQDLLSDQQRVLGPDHPNTLTTLNNLAHLRGQAGDHAEAASAFQELLNERMRILGPDHPDTLATRTNLAGWSYESGERDKAIALLEALIPDLERILGPDHPDTFNARNGVALWRGEVGDPAGAAQAYEALLSGQLRVLGPDHPDTLITRNNLADWRGEAGDAAGATVAFQELLNDHLRVLGPDHPDTLTTRSNLAVWTHESGDAIKAVELFTALLRDQFRVLGSDHPDTQRTKKILQRWQEALSEE